MPSKVDLRVSFSLWFPLISRFSGLPAEGRFSASSLVAAPPSEQHFHPRARRCFPAPLPNNSLSQSSENHFCWTKLDLAPSVLMTFVFHLERKPISEKEVGGTWSDRWVRAWEKRRAAESHATALRLFFATKLQLEGRFYPHRSPARMTSAQGVHVACLLVSFSGLISHLSHCANCVWMEK